MSGSRTAAEPQPQILIAPATGRRTSPAAALGAAVIGFFVITLDALIVSVALPSMGDDLGGGITGLQWVVDGYTLMLAALLLSAGAISDRIGARQAFGAGLALFLVASAACGFAPTLPVLVAARLVQGAGAAVMMPATLAIIREAYPDAADRTRALALWAVGGSVGAAAGPLLGGALTVLSWRWIFFINVPVGAVALLLLARVARSPRRPVPFDRTGQITAVLTMGGLTYALIEGGEYGFDRPEVLAALAVAAVSLVVFLLGQARGAHPMMPLDLFRSRPVALSLVAGFALNIGFYGLVFVLSLYFQALRGLSAMATGVAFLPMTLVTAGGAFVSAAIIRRAGARVTMVAGQFVMAGGLLLVCLLPLSTPAWAVALLLVPVGIGGSLAVPAMTGLMLESVAPERAGLAGGVLNTFRQFGGALAVAVFGALIADRATFLHGLRVGLVSAAVLLVATAVLGLRRQPRH
ncbi:MFS transporter [Streptomyces fulvoviolaceus]|uniref:MFS transporter n=1 Tax=Streptomyces fulvoviolaceus TaxID=285535 RepID=UPI0021C12EB8|nr:MFS transporter [Streptomyces fulvoviolaceus]MCT9084013.1 MFS transporter [Streptomyces fulvoviolaceus]